MVREQVLLRDVGRKRQVREPGATDNRCIQCLFFHLFFFFFFFHQQFNYSSFERHLGTYPRHLTRRRLRFFTHSVVNLNAKTESCDLRRLLLSSKDSMCIVHSTAKKTCSCEGSPDWMQLISNKCKKKHSCQGSTIWTTAETFILVHFVFHTGFLFINFFYQTNRCPVKYLLIR